jgi:UDP-N-acetylmuramoyl-L-alanyl-D-glutamate--2,6-diaminopimelate ligase
MSRRGDSTLLRLPTASSVVGAGLGPGPGSSGSESFHPAKVPVLVMEGLPSAPAEGTSLADLLDGVRPTDVRGDPSVVVRDVTYRSAQAGKGSLFFCVPGTRTDGHRFAVAACSAGAVAVVVERWLDVPCTQVLVPSVRAAMGPISSVFFGRPSSSMRVVGVTGTNGKTTTTYLMESIFVRAGMTPGVIGTTGVRLDHRPAAFDRTTPEAPDLQRLLFQMREAGVEAVAMEVSSHGLDQHRVDGTRYACSIFTNLSQDHLDYHGTMEAYFDAKARLFSPDLSDRGVVNLDSAYGPAVVERSTVPTTTFAVETDADLRAMGVELRSDGLSFTADGVTIRSRLRGSYNVSNCLGAMAAARSVGIDDRAIVEGIPNVPGVPGRLEPVEAGQPFAVLVDYAHTPDSLENVLRATRWMTNGRLIVVFGCGGDRDRGKRPLMGEVATRLADLTVITSDNPRSEEPEAIIAEIESGARLGRGEYVVEPDRRAAIRLALREARPEDVLIVAGKGHETGQEFGDRTIPFDDRIVAREEWRTLRSGRETP